MKRRARGRFGLAWMALLAALANNYSYFGVSAAFMPHTHVCVHQRL